MIPKALQAYATMEALWNQGMDIIEIYSMMSVGYLESVVKDGTKATEDGLKSYFKEEYGIDNLTLGACRKILQRFKKKGMLSASDHAYVVVVGKLNGYLTNRIQAPDISDKIRRVIAELKLQAKSAHGLDLTEVEVEKGLLQFFSRNDGEIILNNGESLSGDNLRHKPDTKGQKLKYIISRYVIDKQTADPEIFDTLQSFATGNMVASVMAMDDFTAFDGSLKHLTVYVDSPLVFALLGLTHDSERRIVVELMTRLKELKASVKIERHHHSEISSAIHHAVGLLEEEYPDLSKVNKLYLYAKDNGLDANDLVMKTQQIQSVLDQYGIEVENVTLKEATRLYDWKALEAEIIDIYTDGGITYLAPYRRNSIQRDSKALAHVLAVRQDRQPVALRGCKALLVTNNLGLCKLGLSTPETPQCLGLPVCVTTETFSTILWGNRPTPNSALNKTKLVCECVRNITLKASIVRNFYNSLKRKHEAHAITDQDYLNATTSKMVNQMLREETFNNENFYSDDTANDILRRILRQRQLAKEESDDENSRQQDKLWRLSRNVGNGISIAVGCALLALALLTRFWDWGDMDPGARACFWTFAALFCAWGILNWLGVIPSRLRIRDMIARKVYRLLSVKESVPSQS